MPMRHYFVSTLLLIALTSVTTACGTDHRNEDFCTSVCECIRDPADVEECTNTCIADLDEADEQQDQPLVSAECLACVNQSSCQRLRTSCNTECAIEDDPEDQ